MSLKIALVTNNSPRHKHFIVELNKMLNVKCIIIPSQKSTGRGIRHKIKQYGIIWVLLKIISTLYVKWSKSSYLNLLKRTENVFFNSSFKEFNEIDPARIHRLETVNSKVAIDLIRNNQIDVICFLGGDIARKNFINSARIACLNIHSGLSPFYNGSNSAQWTFADFRPNFCGVTLMRMNERIDGGNIISHYLPEITSKDDVSTLFCKGINGGIQLILDEIKNINNGDVFSGIRQNRCFKYTRGMDWVIYHDLRLNLFHKSGRIKLYNRKEKIFTYADITDENFPFSKILDYILNNK